MNDKKDNINENQTNTIEDEIKKDAINVGGSVIGAIVGLVFGGPIGAVIGATTAPAMGMTYNLINRAVERRKERIIYCK